MIPERLIAFIEAKPGNQLVIEATGTKTVTKFDASLYEVREGYSRPSMVAFAFGETANEAIAALDLKWFHRNRKPMMF